MTECFKAELRPDAWMDWTRIEEDGSPGMQGPILKVMQHASSVHLTPRTAGELAEVLTRWCKRVSPPTTIREDARR